MFAACLYLARWQWDRSQTPSGTFQNLGYALQWPFFGLFAVYVWWRAPGLGQRQANAVRDATPRVPVTSRPLPQEIGRRRSLAERPDDTEEGRELAAYNAYLARLNQQETV